MSLPKNCLYTNAIETSLCRNYQSNISLQNGSGPYHCGETMIVNIPTGLNTVMSGADSVFKFSLTVKNGGTASNYIRLAQSAHSLISRVRVFHGSTMLSDITDYNQLVAMLSSLQTPSDSRQKQSILSGVEQFQHTDVTTNQTSCTMTGERLNGLNATAIGGSTTTRTYCIPIMNFLSYSDKYIPLFAMTGAPLQIQLQIISNPLEGLCCEQTLDAATPITLTNCEMICNFMELSDAGMSKIISASGGGPLKWVVQDYKNITNSGDIAPDRELSIPVVARYMSLRSLFFCFRTHSAGAITFNPLETNHFGISEYNVRVGSHVLPVKAPSSIPEMYAEVLRSIGSISDLNHNCSVGLDIYDSKEPMANTEVAATYHASAYPSAFYIGLDLESYSSSGMDSVYQGYNSSTSDIFFTPKFNHNASTVTAKINSFAMYDQVVIIENGMASISF